MIIADILNSLFVFLLVKKYAAKKFALICTSLYIFNPVLIANSTLWGQNDSIITFFILSSLYFLTSKQIILSATLLGLGFATKQLVLFCLPVYLIYLSFLKFSKLKFVTFTLVFLTAATLLFIPFFPGDNFTQFLLNRFEAATSWFPYTTLNAFNFWAIVSNLYFGSIDFVSDQNKFLNIPFRIWGYLLFITSYLAVLITFIKKLRFISTESNRYSTLHFTLYTLTLIYFSMFLFLTQIRERHLYYALTLLIPLIAIFPLKKWFIFIPLYLNYGFNLSYSFLAPSQTPLILNPTVLIFLSFLNIFYFIYLLRYYLKHLGWQDNIPPL